MKIAYLANVRIPSERAHAAQIVHMCQAFAQHGHEVTLFCSKRGVGTREAVAAEFALQPEFSLVRLGSRRLHAWWRGMFYLRELRFALAFLVGYGAKKYDVVYCRSEWIVWVLSFFVSANKLVWESHEAKYTYPARKLLHAGTKTVVISQGIAAAYRKRGVPEERLLVADDGIDESFFTPTETKTEVRARLGLSQDAFVVMYLGGFDAWKGVETFFEAAELDPEMLFVAAGGHEEQLPALAQQYPTVQFLGPTPYRDLANNQQAADILVIPNTATTPLSAQYTSPLKLFAHMASGVPLIVSDIPSLTTITGTDATTFTPDSPQALATAIQSVKTNHTQAQTTATTLKERSRVYTWYNRAKHIIEFVFVK